MRNSPRSESWIDRAIAVVSPSLACERAAARVKLGAVSATGGYLSERRRRFLRDVPRLDGGPDSAILPDLDELRTVCRYLDRTNPLARGANRTIATDTVGTGLRLQARVDAEALGLSATEARAIERRLELIFHHFSGRCDYRRQLSWWQFQYVALYSQLLGGDFWVALSWRQDAGDNLGIKLQAIEGDRVSNPDRALDTPAIAGGVEVDAFGVPFRVHVCSGYPFDWRWLQKPLTWTPIDLFDSAGHRRMLQITDVTRPGQTRGVPELAVAVEAMKNLGDYSEAELAAAVISACFAIVTKTNDGSGMTLPGSTANSAGLAKVDIGYTPGLTVDGLAPGETIEAFKADRPNVNFPNFYGALAEQIGASLGLSKGMILRRFESSYSAARAEFLVVWREVARRRQNLVWQLCQPVYEAVVGEAVDRGLVSLRGWDDPLLRDAWLGAEWIGPAQGQLNPLDEAKAASARVALGISTRAKEAAAFDGGDYDAVYRALVEEEKARQRDGIGFDAAKNSQDAAVNSEQGAPQ